jgi:hypothetical protein
VSAPRWGRRRPQRSIVFVEACASISTGRSPSSVSDTGRMCISV